MGERKWEAGKHYCLECGGFLNKSNTDIGGYGNGILCNLCHSKEIHRAFKGESHFSTSSSNGLQPKIFYYCEDCGTKLESPGICRCTTCEEALLNFFRS